MIVEFQALNDMIAEAQADISVGLQIGQLRDRAAAHVKAGDRTRLAREIDFIGGSASRPGPAESLSATGEGQMYSVGLGFCRTYAHKPPFTCRGGSTDLDANDKWLSMLRRMRAFAPLWVE
jgi:hypothetical protein